MPDSLCVGQSTARTRNSRCASAARSAGSGSSAAISPKDETGSTRLLTLGEDDTVLPLRARCLFAAGDLALAQGCFSEAQRRASGPLALWRRLGDLRHAASALYLLGLLACARGESDRAHVLLPQALRSAHSSGNAAYESLTLPQLSNLARADADLKRARASAEQAIEQATRIGWAQIRPYALMLLADIHFEQGTNASALPRRGGGRGDAAAGSRALVASPGAHEPGPGQ